ncbi:hypothetical protein CERSUDRAFT_76363 [Gelatoporia subvermispora B]|uniref:DUF6533 domain-containing protein n=1 Tax=Ceriporiopsis subvermispora (strain B) TaxID=914234 RepID=M2R3Y9_CERS8|nr:hypothetical protein CERSUDRAFT_76363 [Gelatoporia subvermispora B]
MSANQTQSQAEAAAEVISFVQTEFVYNCCALASSVVVLYDHILTFPQEVRVMWKRKFSIVITLFHVNRWALFSEAILNLILFLPLPSLLSCNAVNYLLSISGLVLLIVWAVFSTVRVFAISAGNWYLSLATLVIGLVPLGANIDYAFFTAQNEIDSLPFLGTFCDDNQTASMALIIALTTTSRVCAIVSDVIVLLVTWFKTYSIKRTADRTGTRAPLASMLIRDGTFYFVLILLLNILQIVGNNTGVFAGTTGFFGQPLSGIIVSRFLMNLRQLDRTTSDAAVTRQPFGISLSGEQSEYTQGSSLRFVSMLGNMGEELEHGSEDVTWPPDTSDDDQVLDVNASSSEGVDVYETVL